MTKDATGDATDDAAHVARALRAERARLFVASLWPAVGAQLAVAPLMVAVLAGHVPGTALALWVLVLLGSVLLRVWAVLPIQRRPEVLARPSPAVLWRLRAAVMGSGAAWGTAGLLLFPGGDLQSLTFLVFVLGGMAAGSFTLTSFDLRAALGFGALAVLPLVVRLVLEGTGATLTMGLMVSAFVGFLALTGWRAQRQFQDATTASALAARRAATLQQAQQQQLQLAQALADKSEALRLTLDNMDQGILSFGSDGRLQIHNRRAQELLELPASVLEGRPTLDEIAQHQYVHGHYGQALGLVDEAARPTLARWLDGDRQRFPDRYIRRTPRGTVLEVRSHHLADGALVRTFADVTAFFDAQRRLQDSQAQERKLALVAAHTQDAVAVLDAQLRIEWVNVGFTRLTGYPPEEAVGRFPVELLHADGLDIEAVARLDEVIRRDGRGAGELRQRGRDGHTYWCALEVQAICDAEGRVQQYISISRDISQRRADEAALHAARDEAERASRAKSDFLSAMSHELRTPMNAILGFAQLLRTDTAQPLTPRQRLQVDQVASAGQHLLALINDVLDLSRVEAGKQAVDLRPVAVAALLDECLALVRPLALARGVRLLPLPPTQCGASVLADSTRLRQVLLNLLANAIKYNRADGQVGLACRVAGQTVHIEVSDQGPGLDAAAQARLFQPFERLGAEDGPVEGAGIGLALSRRLLALMAGRIDVRSTPGQGSTFVLSLPLAGVEREPDPPSAAEASPGAERLDTTLAAGGPGGMLRSMAGAMRNGEGAQPVDALPAAGEARTAPGPAAQPRLRQVLYIEDNPVNVLLMEAALEREPGLRLVSAPLPLLGLELARATPPDLVLLDIQLPGIDGFEVLRRLRADAVTQHVPVVAVSANAMPDDLARARAAGFDDYLTKPLDLARLQALVQNPPTRRADGAAAGDVHMARPA